MTLVSIPYSSYSSTVVSCILQPYTRLKTMPKIATLSQTCYFPKTTETRFFVCVISQET